MVAFEGLQLSEEMHPKLAAMDGFLAELPSSAPADK